MIDALFGNDTNGRNLPHDLQQRVFQELHSDSPSIIRVKIEYRYSIDSLNRSSIVYEQASPLQMTMYYSQSAYGPWLMVSPSAYKLDLVGYPKTYDEFEFGWSRVINNDTVPLSKPLYWDFALPNGVINYKELSKLKAVTDVMMTLDPMDGKLSNALGHVLQWFTEVFPRPLRGYTTMTFEPTFLKRWNPYQREKLSEIQMDCVYIYSSPQSSLLATFKDGARVLRS